MLENPGFLHHNDKVQFDLEVMNGRDAGILFLSSLALQQQLYPVSLSLTLWRCYKSKPGDSFYMTKGFLVR